MFQCYQSSRTPKTGRAATNLFLQLKWDLTDFETHRYNVRTAKTSIDNGAPLTYSHLYYRPKKLQLELERFSTIQRNNKFLLERIARIQREGAWVDNKNYHDIKSLNIWKRQKEMIELAYNNQTMLNRLLDCTSYYNRSKIEDEYLLNQKYKANVQKYPKDWRNILQQIKLIQKSIRKKVISEKTGKYHPSMKRIKNKWTLEKDAFRIEKEKKAAQEAIETEEEERSVKEERQEAAKKFRKRKEEYAEASKKWREAREERLHLVEQQQKEAKDTELEEKRLISEKLLQQKEKVKREIEQWREMKAKELELEELEMKKRESERKHRESEKLHRRRAKAKKDLEEWKRQKKARDAEREALEKKEEKLKSRTGLLLVQRRKLQPASKTKMPDSKESQLSDETRKRRPAERKLSENVRKDHKPKRLEDEEGKMAKEAEIKRSGTTAEGREFTKEEEDVLKLSRDIRENIDNKRRHTLEGSEGKVAEAKPHEGISVEKEIEESQFDSDNQDSADNEKLQASEAQKIETTSEKDEFKESLVTETLEESTRKKPKYETIEHKLREVEKRQMQNKIKQDPDIPKTTLDSVTDRSLQLTEMTREAEKIKKVSDDNNKSVEKSDNQKDKDIKDEQVNDADSEGIKNTNSESKKSPEGNKVAEDLGKVHIMTEKGKVEDVNLGEVKAESEREALRESADVEVTEETQNRKLPEGNKVAEDLGKVHIMTEKGKVEDVNLDKVKAESEREALRESTDVEASKETESSNLVDENASEHLGTAHVITREGKVKEINLAEVKDESHLEGLLDPTDLEPKKEMIVDTKDKTKRLLEEKDSESTNAAQTVHVYKDGSVKEITLDEILKKESEEKTEVTEQPEDEKDEEKKDTEEGSKFKIDGQIDKETEDKDADNVKGNEIGRDKTLSENNTGFIVKDEVEVKEEKFSEGNEVVEDLGKVHGAEEGKLSEIKAEGKRGALRKSADTEEAENADIPKPIDEKASKAESEKKDPANSTDTKSTREKDAKSTKEKTEVTEQPKDEKIEEKKNTDEGSKLKNDGKKGKETEDKDDVSGSEIGRDNALSENNKRMIVKDEVEKFSKGNEVVEDLGKVHGAEEGKLEDVDLVEVKAESKRDLRESSDTEAAEKDDIPKRIDEETGKVEGKTKALSDANDAETTEEIETSQIMNEESVNKESGSEVTNELTDAETPKKREKSIDDKMATKAESEKKASSNSTNAESTREEDTARDIDVDKEDGKMSKGSLDEILRKESEEKVKGKNKSEDGKS